jgi:putative endonuclease
MAASPVKRTTGPGGEEYAVRALLEDGYRILAVNAHSPYGEVDIIAADRDTVCFVEVKTRRAGAQVGAGLSVTKVKQRKILRTAMLWLQENDCDLQPRFDVFAVTTDSDGTIIGHDHMKGAFDGQAYE